MEERIAMIQEEKELLLKDLCARLPYGVKIHNPHPKFPNTNEYIQTLTDIHGTMQSNWITFGTDCEEIDVNWNIGNKEEDVPKPYLRPIAQMTEEEVDERNQIALFHSGNIASVPTYIDWLNANHFDYRGLIKRGLALEAPSNMYNN